VQILYVDVVDENRMIIQNDTLLLKFPSVTVKNQLIVANKNGVDSWKCYAESESVNCRTIRFALVCKLLIFLFI
jgi:hypothetical protein